MLRLPFHLLLALALMAAPTVVGALEPVRVADSVYAFIGLPGEVAPENDGHVGNAGFIVGDTGIVVVDTGISYRYGRAMLEAIARVSAKPVVLVINTHAVQEFLFGNAAFADQGVPLLAHVESVGLMRQRCEHCLGNLQLILGAERMAGTRLVIPERTVAGSTTLTSPDGRSTCCTMAGRARRVIWPCSIARAACCSPGDCWPTAACSELRDGRYRGWLDALDVFEAQILSYMKLTGKKVGLLINFNSKMVKDGIKRFVL